MKTIISCASGKCQISVNEETGSLLSFRSVQPMQEFIAPKCGERPIFSIQLRDSTGKSTRLSALQADKISFVRRDSQEGTMMRFYFKRLGGQAIDAQTEILCPKEKALTHWTINIKNHTGKTLEWIDYPCVIVPTKLAKSGSERLLWPREEGVLLHDLEKAPLWVEESLLSEPADPFKIYPGKITAQLMAYYNNVAGLYTAAYDSAANPKILAPLKVNEGVRLTYLHFRGSEKGEDSLGYPVVLGVFNGDWYDAAKIYREWAREQPWCSTPIPTRRNIPSWWLDSPIEVVFLLRGHRDDDDDLSPNPEYMPLSNCLPLLDELSKKFESPLVPVVFHWERDGPWTEPDAFPPYGAVEEEYRHFFGEISRRGWHGGVYASGTRWVISNPKAAYNGLAFFRNNNGEECVCRLPDGGLWVEDWGWRRSYLCCANQISTKEMALRQIRKLMEYNCDFLQFFDQNLGGTSFPCYAQNHHHPPSPGLWQTHEMSTLLKAVQLLFQESGREIALSTEGPVAEPFIPHYALADGRSTWQHEIGEAIPLYQFLYHEFIQIHNGIFWDINDPDTLLLKTALACVNGDGICVVLREKGKINRGHNVLWERTLLDQNSCITLIRRVNKLRRGTGREYLILGQMQRPPMIGNVSERIFVTDGGKTCRFPAVLSSAWRSPEGLYALVLVNYSSETHNPIIRFDEKSHNGKVYKIRASLVEAEKPITQTITPPSHMAISMPPLSVALVEFIQN